MWYSYHIHVIVVFIMSNTDFICDSVKNSGWIAKSKMSQTYGKRSLRKASTEVKLSNITCQSSSAIECNAAYDNFMAGDCSSKL